MSQPNRNSHISGAQVSQAAQSTDMVGASAFTDGPHKAGSPPYNVLPQPSGNQGEFYRWRAIPSNAHCSNPVT
jgi:hypothetical protein